MKNYEFKVYLGTTKGSRPEAVYLRGFSWDCGWYYGGGYIGNSQFHAHFDRAFLDMPDPRGHILGNFTTPWNKTEGCTVISNGVSVWESLSFFLDDAQFTDAEWWRIKDLYKQFYALRDAVEVFQYGGYCTSSGRTEAEINKEMAEKINLHLQNIIIPEICKALRVNKEVKP